MSRKGNKQTEIFHAALSAFTTSGYEATTIRNILDLTEKNGKKISRKTFYKLFDSKEDILHDIIEYYKNENIKKYFSNKIDNFEELSPMDKLVALLTEKFDHAKKENFSLIKVNYRLLLDPKLQKLFNLDIHEYNKSVSLQLEEILKEITPNYKTVAIMINNYIRGMLVEILSQHVINEKFDHDEFVEEIKTESIQQIKLLLSNH